MPAKEIKKESIKKILVIKQRNIGDVLLTVPTINALREGFHDAHIAMLVNSGTEEMLTLHPSLDEVIVFDQKWKEKPFIRRAAKEISFLRTIRQKGFDMVINLTEGDRGALTALLSGAKYRIGFDPKGKGFWGKRYLFTHLQKTPDPRLHVVDYNLEILKVLGLKAKERDVSIYFSKQDEEKIEKIFRQNGIEKEDVLVLVHPTSRWLFKCWEDRKTAAIIDFFQIKRKARVFLTAAPIRKELEKIERILHYTKSEPVNLSGKLTLKELAALAKRCDLFFGIDSAPMHIAAAVKTPVIALFGPSGEFNWGPWGEGHTVITKEMDCRPCGRDGCNGTKKSLCLENIEVDDVIEKINSRLEVIYENRPHKKEI
jgi:heptosyltransferase-3